MKDFLSDWVSNRILLCDDPSICSTINDKKYGLDEILITNLDKMGITQLFPGNRFLCF